jgi:hypothetical protein
MPNTLAFLMVLLWPFIAYRLFTRLPPAQALVWSVLGAYMLLPPLTGFDLPALPEMNKFTLSNVCALGFVMFLLKEKLDFLTDGPVGKILIVLFVASPFITTLTNPDPIPILEQDVPALRLYDSVASISYQLISLIPLFLARRLLSTAEGMRVMVGALVAAGLVYSVPMLFEARFSPQLNVWIYGFFQHDFSQSMRGGGFRPMVFMPHGLWVAFFALMAAMSALLMLRLSTPEERPKRLLVFVYLFFVLVACRSAGPLVYALALCPVIVVVGRRWQILLASLMGIVVITYPFLRGAQLIPLDDILQFALTQSAERHQSLEFRIINEELLLDRAMLKPWFGWGGYGRNLILDPFDGRILTIPDGQWIIVLGTYGWFGYIAEFGLLTLPLILLGREALLSPSEAFSRFGCLIALVYAANLADLLPNATLIPFTWLMAGALLGWAEALARTRKQLAKDQWKASLSRGSGPRTVL